MEKKSSKEIPNEKKQNNEVNNKNKFYNFLNKKKATLESKDSQDLSDQSSNSGNNKLYQNNANYLNTLLKKSFYNTINNNSLSSTSPSRQKKENNNSLLYPTNVPKNFIPLYLYENINLDMNKKTTRQLKNELRNVLDLHEKQKNEMKKYEEDIKKIQLDLKKAKEAKNNVMEEVFHLKKEIEQINETESTNSISNYSKRFTLQTGNIKNLLKNMGMNDLKEENEKKIEELDNEIREYEDKISKLKFDNAGFMEDYDMLLNDYKNNLNKNLKINQFIANIDKKTKEALQEKENLKKYIK